MSNNIKTTAVIMAAGKGTRMKSALPKVLHKAAGRTMLQQVLHQVRTAGVDEQVIVVGHGATLPCKCHSLAPATVCSKPCPKSRRTLRRC